MAKIVVSTPEMLATMKEQAEKRKRNKGINKTILALAASKGISIAEAQQELIEREIKGKKALAAAKRIRIKKPKSSIKYTAKIVSGGGANGTGKKG